ncbi:AP-3 adaptor complex subunit beta [Blumeria hordei DH14]|uniref:AP-3 adaptor complex subunit beta n=1 Tax=Blumeria graminis f. sp. hordei (strain DH14) TaxID=546991 RepID=N1JA14_BLUG1|nr:AP-3 adaptor complex subunit beta [Blumeria hordei DH14]
MESISRISNLLESARELTLDAALSARSSQDPSKTVPAPLIKRLLDSRNNRDILDGLRKVISLMYRSQPCIEFFSSVVKNVASSNIEIKKLVYIYLLNHAEQEPDLALLSINTIQKSLSDGNPQIRALALRAISGIRVPVISQIVSLAIKKGISDMSPFVRKAASLAIPKCYRLDPSTLPQLFTYLSILLGDKQSQVSGAAVMAFMEVCPERIDLIHQHYRGLVKSLVDMNEWSQLATLNLMTIYSRKCFPRQIRKVAKSHGGSDAFYGNEGHNSPEDVQEFQVLDPDLELLLKNIKPLLQSRNSAVVVAVCRCYTNLGTDEYINASIGPLVALLRGPQDIQHITLQNIVLVCIKNPKAFVKYISHFLIHITDSPKVWKLKLEILTLIFPHCHENFKSLILNELEHFSQKSTESELTREAVRAIGRCAQSDNRKSSLCLRLLLKQINSQDGNLVDEALTVIRHLIQQDPGSHTTTVIRLAKNLDSTSNPRARASIIWLVGEFSGTDGSDNIAADVLRILAKGFAEEAESAKLQIVLLAAKVYLQHLIRTDSQTQNSATDHHLDNLVIHQDFDNNDFQGLREGCAVSQSSSRPEHPIVLLWNYITLLARYDTSYDLRDRTRLYKALLAVPSSTDLAALMLLAPKPVPHIASPSENRMGFTLGSASLVICENSGLHGIQGYEGLPEWVQPGFEPDPALREIDLSKLEYDVTRIIPAGEKLDIAVQHGGNRPLSGMNGPILNADRAKTLDCWLAEEDDNNEHGVNDDPEDESESESEDDEDEDEDDEEDSEEYSEGTLQEESSNDEGSNEHNLLVR